MVGTFWEYAMDYACESKCDEDRMHHTFCNASILLIIRNRESIRNRFTFAETKGGCQSFEYHLATNQSQCQSMTLTVVGVMLDWDAIGSSPTTFREVRRENSSWGANQMMAKLVLDDRGLIIGQPGTR